MKRNRVFKGYMIIFFIFSFLSAVIIGGKFILPVGVEYSPSSVKAESASLFSSDIYTPVKKYSSVYKSSTFGIDEGDRLKGCTLGEKYSSFSSVDSDEYAHLFFVTYSMRPSCTLRGVFRSPDGAKLELIIYMDTSNFTRAILTLDAVTASSVSRKIDLELEISRIENILVFASTRTGLFVYSFANLAFYEVSKLFSPNYFLSEQEPASVYGSEGFVDDPFRMIFEGQLTLDSFIVEGGAGSFFESVEFWNYDYFYECPNCARDFESAEALASHIEESHNFVCEYCEERFYTAAELAVHIKERHNFFCEYCGEKFATEDDLSSHIEEAHKYVCEYCGERFATEGDLTSHIEERHNFVCEYCGERFYTEDDLASHMEEAHKFVCGNCGVRFFTEDDLAVHEKDCHKCDNCSGLFFGTSAFDAHFRLRVDYPFWCRHCCTVFGRPSCPDISSPYDLAVIEDFCAHLVNVHEAPIVCNNCLKTFSDQSEFENHVPQCYVPVGDGDEGDTGGDDGNGEGDEDSDGDNGGNGGNEGVTPGDGDDGNNGGDDGIVLEKKFTFRFPPSLKNLKNLFDGDFWKALFSGEIEGLGNFILFVVLLLLLLLFLPILSIFLPSVRAFLGRIFKIIWKGITYLFKGLWWLISAPFKGIAALFSKNKGR